MSPLVVHVGWSGWVAWRVFSGSLWYRNGCSSRSHHTVPTAPVGSSRPSSSQMWTIPMTPSRPTDPGCASACCESMNVAPAPSVEA